MTADRPLAAVLSPIPWHGLWTSRHELAGALGRRGWHVLFFDPPANRARRVARSAPRRPGGPPPAGVEVLTPPAYLPYGWARGLGAAGRAVVDLNAARYARYVAGAVATATGAGRGRRPGGGVDLLINSFMPVLGYRVDREVAARVRVYHRADELRQFPSWCEQYSRLEEAVARHADVVA
ncbi:MAG TPA: hypothetical protein VMW49_01675, partial [Candidatus Dormibacteraeota bacterium]|nr:hypothetical protein [Candidatus Dormibacteraeota bacterium]